MLSAIILLTSLNSIGMEMVLIPAGSFQMGSWNGQPNEQPVHRVKITRPFYMSAHEVTVGQFRQFVEETGYRTEAERDVAGGFGIDFATGAVQQKSGITWRDPGFPAFRQTDNHPVILISWADAESFCRWLSEKEGRQYRLPTEAEWEYAAGGGGPANIADASLRQAIPMATWAADRNDGHAFTAPVGSYAPNAFGLYDMIGNVWEWCSDWYGADYYAVSPRDDPQGPSAGQFRAIRGGGWFNGIKRNRASQRIYFDPTFRYCLLSGFRVVLETTP